MKARLILIALLAIAGLSVSAAVLSYNQPVATTTNTSVPQELPLTRENLLMLVNKERSKVGVAPLVVDDMLNDSAQWKANDMVEFDYLAHVKPGETEGNGLKYLDELNKSTPKCVHISENLAWRYSKDQLSANAALEEWKGSEPHYKAMVSPEYTLTGFGTGTYLVVQHFCKP